MKKPLPDHVRRKIAQQHPEHADLVGLKKPPSHSKTKQAKTKPRIGNIYFDSEAERDAYLRLSQKYPAVIAHGCIRLSDNRHIEPDFVIIDHVHDDGSFTGRLADAKAVWAGRSTPHIERDWSVKRDWLDQNTGLKIDIITSETEEDEL